jgi:hypothetical protein
MNSKNDRQTRSATRTSIAAPENQQQTVEEEQELQQSEVRSSKEASKKSTKKDQKKKAKAQRKWRHKQFRPYHGEIRSTAGEEELVLKIPLQGLWSSSTNDTAGKRTGVQGVYMSRNQEDTRVQGGSM